MIIPDLEALSVPLDRLDSLPGNPRRGDVDAVARSYETFGQRKPIVARRGEGGRGTVLAGNHQLAAARKLGWADIAVVWVDDDDEMASAFALADNRTAELGSYDEQGLADLFASIEDEALLAASGWSDESVAELLAQAGVEELPEGATDPDAVPDAPDEPVSKLGDVWLLGRHRVTCGDSTDVGVLDRVMDGGKARMVWTDPPYGVVYVGSGRAAAEGTERKSIANDSLSASELDDLLRAAFAAAFSASEEGASWYVAAPPGPSSLSFTQALTDLGIWRQTLAWIKDTFVIGRSDYHGRHETIYYGWVPGAAHTWESDRKQDTVLEFPRPRKSKEHPTMKPVELIEYCIGNSSKRGAVVLDPFGGSGSTLLAAHRTGRTARLVELDPAYVDVICRRYQEHTGEKPVLESTGEPHDFTSA